MRQQVLYIEYSLYIVRRALIYRDAAVVVFHDALQYIGITALYIDGDNVLPDCHYFLDRLVSEAYYSLKHALLVLYVFGICKLKRLFQFVDTEHVVLLLHTFSASMPLRRSMLSKGQNSFLKNMIPRTALRQKRNGF